MYPQKAPLFKSSFSTPWPVICWEPCSQPAIRWSMSHEPRDFMWEYWVTWEPISSCCPPAMALQPAGGRRRGQIPGIQAGCCLRSLLVLVLPLPTRCGPWGTGLPDLCPPMPAHCPDPVFFHQAPDIAGCGFGNHPVMRPHNACVIVFCIAIRN